MKKVLASGLLALCAAGTVLSGSAMAAKAAAEGTAASGAQPQAVAVTVASPNQPANLNFELS